MLISIQIESEILAWKMGWGILEQGWRKGPWTPEEDRLLGEYVKLHGEGRWSCVSRSTGKLILLLSCKGDRFRER